MVPLDWAMVIGTYCWKFKHRHYVALDRVTLTGRCLETFSTTIFVDITMTLEWTPLGCELTYGLCSCAHQITFHLIDLLVLTILIKFLSYYYCLFVFPALFSVFIFICALMCFQHFP